jgi:hypothetical protein
VCVSLRVCVCVCVCVCACVRVYRRLCIDICAGADQEADHVHMPVLRGYVDRRGSILPTQTERATQEIERAISGRPATYRPHTARPHAAGTPAVHATARRRARRCRRPVIQSDRRRPPGPGPAAARARTACASAPPLLPHSDVRLTPHRAARVAAGAALVCRPSRSRVCMF